MYRDAMKRLLDPTLGVRFIFWDIVTADVHPVSTAYTPISCHSVARGSDLLASLLLCWRWSR